jgi:hypothetical protein
MERHAIFRGRSRCRLLQGSRSLTLKVTQFTPDVTDFFTPEVTVHLSTVNTRIPSQNTRFARINAGFLRRRSLRALDPFASALCLELLARIAEALRPNEGKLGSNSGLGPLLRDRFSRSVVFHA